MINNVKVGDRFRGLVNNEIFDVVNVDESKDQIVVKANNGRNIIYGLQAFKHLMIEKI